jgi:hypothetical protein
MAAATSVAFASQAAAQNGFYAGIAYSQTTGKIGYTVRRARTEAEAQKLAAENCGAPDAKTFIWGPSQWVAIAIADALPGTAGFGRGNSSEEAQRRALDECVKRAHGEACRVALCVESQGGRAQSLMSVARDPKLPPPAPKSGFMAAIAYSPSTGRIGSTAGQARTKEEAQALALKDCPAPDAKAFMWGEQWIAVAVATDRKGVAGFAPGASREAAESAALAECKKHSHGAPCKIALTLYSGGHGTAVQGEKTKADAAKPGAGSAGAAPPEPRKNAGPASANGATPVAPVAAK